MRAWILVPFLATGGLPAQDPISLQELREIARQRFETERPKQLEALEPFLEDLQMDYRQSSEYLDRRFAMAAELGDGIVPALLEKLSPQEEGDRAHRNIAENSARVLLRLDPSGFIDPLIEICQSSSYTARRLAIWLLGHTGSREAERALIAMLETDNPSQRVQIIRALQLLGSTDAAATIASFLGSDNEALKTTALRYLAETKAPAAVERVLQALAAEKTNELVPLYVTYLAGAAHRDAAAADALIRLVDPERSDPEQLLSIVRSLARVAPVKHQATIAACRAVLDLGNTAELGLACALTMRELGDKSGIKDLLEKLRQEIRRDSKNDVPFVNRANAYLALEQWDDASKDYQNAVDRTENRVLRRGLYLQVARCEAHQGRWNAVLKALKESRASYAVIMVAASEDPALRKALEHRSIRKYVDRLPKGGANTSR